MKLQEQEIKILRDIRIHKILGVKDDGRRLTIRCPFHNERTPSCVIYPDNSFHCYACQANGSGAIDFCVQNGLNFIEAVEFLSDYL